MESVSFRLKMLSLYSRALGNPTRIAILEYIANKKKTYFSELTQQLDIPKATCSQHIRYLERSRLIKVTSDESRPYYSIDEENWYRFKAYFESFISNCPCYRRPGHDCSPCCPEINNDCCGRPLSESGCCDCCADDRG